MSPRAQRRAASEGLIGGRVLFLQEPSWLEFFGVSSPNSRIGMHDRHGHLDDHAFPEEVLVFEHDVFADIAGAGAGGVHSEELLECGVQERAIFSHAKDPEISSGWLTRTIRQ